jgi:2-oxoisovalerate dehydrogenase E1 component alpha subunit
VELATDLSPSTILLRDLYQRMVLTRLVDEYCWQLYQSGRIGFVASCRGHEAAQVGTATCIRAGFDFTLPYYRDLGVVLTLGMTPYEVFRTYLQGWPPVEPVQPAVAIQHWGYHKHNMISGPVPVATQILHAAGIAFACKLRKSTAVAVAYCGDGATAEPDFAEGLSFATQHGLPAIFICEQDSLSDPQEPCRSRAPALPTLSTSSPCPQLTCRSLDGSDILAVHAAMSEALRQARDGQGPVLLELRIRRSAPGEAPDDGDPLVRCRALLQEQSAWSEAWHSSLLTRLRSEVEQALEDALRQSRS